MGGKSRYSDEGVLRILASNGPATAETLWRRYPYLRRHNTETLQRHLNAMCKIGAAVRKRQPEGRSWVYGLTPERLDEIVREETQPRWER